MFSVRIFAKKTPESAKFPVFFPVSRDLPRNRTAEDLAVGLKHLFRAVALVRLRVAGNRSAGRPGHPFCRSRQNAAPEGVERRPSFHGLSRRMRADSRSESWPCTHPDPSREAEGGAFRLSAMRAEILVGLSRRIWKEGAETALGRLAFRVAKSSRGRERRREQWPLS